MIDRVPRFSRRGLLGGLLTGLPAVAFVAACSPEVEETSMFEAAECSAELPQMDQPVSQVEASLAVSPDGTRVASLSTVTGVLSVWDAADGALLHQTPGLGGFHLQFLGDERLVFDSHQHLVSLDLDGSNPSSLDTGHEPQLVTDLGIRTINGMAVVGETVVTIGEDGQWGAFRPGTCERAGFVATGVVVASSIAAQGDDAVVVTGARSGPVRFERGADGGEELVALDNSYAAAFSSDDAHLAVSGDRDSVPVLMILEAGSWEVLHQVDMPSRAMSLDSHDGLWAATTHTEPPAMVLFDEDSGEQRDLPLPERTFAARFLPDGTLLTAHAEHGILRWDPATGEQLAHFA